MKQEIETELIESLSANKDEDKGMKEAIDYLLYRGLTVEQFKIFFNNYKKRNNYLTASINDK